MRYRSWPLLATVFALAVAVTACEVPPTFPRNHSPLMMSLTVFPTDIAVSDSAVVTCIATDLDGDTLVYDWETDLRLRIKGQPPAYPVKANSFDNTEAFYPAYQPASIDTVWVACTVRDRRGGGAIRAVTFTVHP